MLLRRAKNLSSENVSFSGQTKNSAGKVLLALRSVGPGFKPQHPIQSPPPTSQAFPETSQSPKDRGIWPKNKGVRKKGKFEFLINLNTIKNAMFSLR